ncbi:MAG TPA: DNA-3-methyladenine glycosylase 2 family protein [Bacteroidetes bacterium]|nr:DNA-3-methyladenine glycosylase 2 family protein [Bacteroidota bacterium]
MTEKLGPKIRSLSMSLEHFKKDKVFYDAIKHITLSDHNPSDNYFHYLLRAIAFQQLSGKAGATIHGRFLLLFPDQNPEPAFLLELEHEALRGVGLSGQKAGYMKNIADFWLKEDLNNTRIDGMSDEEVLAYLTQIKGVGKWTVEIFLMFGMGRPDLFPLDDLGLQQGIAGIYGLKHLPLKELKKEMVRISDGWRPHRTKAALYVWRWKDEGEFW